jgi:CRP-like cAMP-binding protein
MEFDTPDESPCVNCAVRHVSFCGALMAEAPRDSSPTQSRAAKGYRSANENDVICQQGEWSPHVFVLCRGWALRCHQLSDGRRQVLSVLHPGDLFSAATLFDPCPDFSVQALTDVRFYKFNRIELRQLAAASPRIYEALGKILAAEIKEMNDTAVDLGRYDAHTRVVRFVLRVMNRLLARGMMMRDDRFPFPLNDRQIAQAVALTPAEVSHAMALLRKNNIIDVADGVLTVRDPAKLRNSSASMACRDEAGRAVNPVLAERGAATTNRR